MYATLAAVLIVAPTASTAIDAQPLRPRSPLPEGATRFEKLTGLDQGVDFGAYLAPENNRRYLSNSCGLAVGDYDGNGLPDLYLISQDGPNKLFRQTEPWRFEDVTESAGVDGGESWGSGAAFIDFDNDGDLDLLAATYQGPNLCYRSNGDGTFTECAAPVGLDDAGATTMFAPADYDRDGDLDIYVVNNRLWQVGEEAPNMQLKQINGQLVVPDKYKSQVFVYEGRLCEAGQRDRLLRNDGGVFTDVTDASGMLDYGMGLSAVWFDANDDGWPDLYVANDLKSPDCFYINNGDGTFRDEIHTRVPHTPMSSMGADFADINGDGSFDLLVADMAATTHYKAKVLMGEMDADNWFLALSRPPQYMRNALYLSTKTDRMLESAFLSGLAATDWTWAVLFGDLDNDTREDVFVTNGTSKNMNDSDRAAEFRAMKDTATKDELRRHLLSMPPLRERNLAYRASDDLRFDEVGGEWGLDDLGVSAGAMLADMDRDGDLDAIVVNWNNPVGIFRNRTPNDERAVVVKLNGTRSNRFGLGARITATVDGRTLIREMTCARGYMSGAEPVVHIGLGSASHIERLRVDWPSGSTSAFEMLDADHQYTITEPDAFTPPESDEPPTPMFEPIPTSAALSFRHAERAYDDFAREKLLPNKLSQLGPGMAWSDIDGDGDDDVYIGGAAGKAGAVFRNEGGRFSRVAGPWLLDRRSEDMGAVWFDADGDNDEDLFVVSGGVEVNATNDPSLRDRLYLNDGTGRFKKANDAIPDLRNSGSSACAADVDRDGDLDLFVGGRVIPGAYPNTPRSVLLRNDGGTFVDATATMAPGLADVGLVTGATWADVNHDGRIDLLVACEWGPIHLFVGTDTGLERATDRAGLASYLGWWNGVTSADIDRDGDLDLLATNVGLNTKYKASPSDPSLLYAKDFDESGTIDLVEAKQKDGTCFPVRGLSCSSNAMPIVRERFPKFHDFASATLDDIYSESDLSAADTFRVTHLESAVFVNDGNGRFTHRPMHQLAQIAPGFGACVADFDADGHLDTVIAQNFFGPQVETGRMDGGLSLLMRGSDDGKLHPTPITDSGISVAGDATASCVADIDADGAPDVVIATNDGPVRAMRNVGSARPLAVALSFAPGNHKGIGATVTLMHADGTEQSQVVAAGSGYLSQSTPTLYFAQPTASGSRLSVRWPDGSVTERPLTPNESAITVPR